jgi:hypothetical protein
MVEGVGTHFKIRKHEPVHEINLYKATRHKEKFQRDSIEEDQELEGRIAKKEPMKEHSIGGQSRNWPAVT